MPFDATPIARPIADQLHLGRARIERGWCQRRGRDKDGAVCAVVAVTDGPRSHACLEYLRRALGMCHCLSLSGWNDMPERTKEDVLTLYDKAIALASVDALP